MRTRTPDRERDRQDQPEEGGQPVAPLDVVGLEGDWIGHELLPLVVTLRICPRASEAPRSLDFKTATRSYAVPVVDLEFFNRLPAMDATDLAFAGIAKQAELIAAGEISSRELVDLYLERIERYDPATERVQGRVRGARADGGRPGRRPPRRGGERAAPLLGVPIAVKDEHRRGRRGDGAAARTPTASPRRRTAEMVRRLREAGAVIIGKTNMPELGAGPSPRPPPGASRATRGISSAPRRLERRQRGGGGRRPGGRPRWRATARDRSASRRPGAGCSA